MDQFKVGDKVWCLMFGEGQVVSINDTNPHYPIGAKFESGFHTYSRSGKLLEKGARSLFFSKPKIEAATQRPFVPTLNGKFVVVIPYRLDYGYLVGTVHDEDEDCFFLDTGHKIRKTDVVRIQEISKENLL